MSAAARRRSAARIGGLTRAARYSPEELTGPARRGFLAKFEREADPDGNLDPVERARRADVLLRLHMARLNHASVKARSRRAP
jgi:hypothetical protein